MYFKTGNSEYFDRAVVEFANADILQFAALALLTFAIIKKFDLSSVQILAYAAVVSITGQFLTYNFTLPEGGITYILGLFWGSSEISFFPYCSWIAFPLSGYLFGRDLINCDDKAGLYKKMAKVGIPLYIVMMAVAAYIRVDFGQLTGEYQVTYYHMGIYGNICLVAFVLGWISICYLISRYMPKGIMTYFMRLCKNITRIYVIQYILIINAYVFIAGEESNLSFMKSILVFVVIFTLSDIIAELYGIARVTLIKSHMTSKDDK